MHTTTRVLGILSLGLALGCSNNDTSMSTADMAMKLVDLAVTVDQAGPPPDLTVPPDLAVIPPDMTTIFNGCDDASFVDQSAAASRTVTFGVAGNTYSPKCLLINKGQSVTFSGAFGTHPLRGGTTADAAAGSPNNPITLTTGGTTMSFTFPNVVGTYPYICTTHGGGGMTGVVRTK